MYIVLVLIMPCEICGKKLMNEEPGHIYICEACRRKKSHQEIFKEILKKKGFVPIASEEEELAKKKKKRKRARKEAEEEEWYL